MRGIAGAYERKAVRPHVLGRFADLPLAAEMHPAVLIYLDNQVSMGPNSRAGTDRGRGLNENLAREILELHTLGADGGYTQEDVTNFARILSGWTVGGSALRAGRLLKIVTRLWQSGAETNNDGRLCGDRRRVSESSGA